jgi:hypothetical protein
MTAMMSTSDLNIEPEGARGGCIFDFLHRGG